MPLNHRIPQEPLSQVVFVLDYVQLDFHECRYSIFNAFSIHLSERELRRNETGFCDALVSLIGQRLVSATVEDDHLCFVFAQGDVVRVDASGPSPEAWILHQHNGPMIVEENR